MVTRVSSSTFVGRRHELDRATAALARAATGEAVTLLIAGEAGVGKTRYVGEIARIAGVREFRVLTGSCVQLSGGGLPFGAVIEALRRLPRELSAGELDRLAGLGRSELARLMPELAVSSGRTPDIGSSDSSAQGRLFEHLLGFLDRLAEVTPLLVVIEDIHWADQSTLELLNFLVRNIRETRVVLAATYRSDELHRLHPLLPFLGEIERSGRSERLVLGRFDRAEIARQLEGILGARPDPDLVERVLARSEGNAFYAEELLAADALKGRLPDSLREVLLARVATLGESTQEVLRVASAAGTHVDPALIASVLGRDRESLAPALREAVARHVLVPREVDVRELYGFRHALIQEALYADLLPGERASLHAGFARALAQLAAGDSQASLAAELAYHWQAAHDLPHAFDAWIRAGLEAERIYAVADAGSHFERALELWDRIPDAAVRAPLDQVELLIRAAAAAEGPAIARSVAYLRKAIALVDPAKEPARAGLLYERLGYGLANSFDSLDALAAYREAVRLVPPEPSAARARVLAGLGLRLFFMHQHEESAALCEEALRIAQAVGAAVEESRALIPLSGDQVVMGDVEAGLATVRRAGELAAEAGDVYTLALALTWTAGLMILASEYEAAVAAGYEAAAYAIEHGLAARFGVVDLIYAAWPLVMLGRWDEATTVLDRARSYGGVAELAVDENQLVVAALRGEFELATRMARSVQLREEAGDGFTIPPGLAELALWRSDPLRARAMVREGMDMLDSRHRVTVDDLGWACWVGLRAEADVATAARARGSQAELDEARSIGSGLLARVLALRDEILSRRPYYRAHARAWLATCEAEFSRLDGAHDPIPWESAAAQWGDLRVPYFVAYLQMREGEAALMGSGDRHRARRALTAARVIAVELGAEPLRSAIDALAARALGRSGLGELIAPGPEQASDAGVRRRDQHHRSGLGAASGREGLTPRELDVLSLLAAGRSDGEIADALYISKKTASSHVAHIKDKLAATSRVEIATTAIGLGLITAAAAPN